MLTRALASVAANNGGWALLIEVSDMWTGFGISMYGEACETCGKMIDTTAEEPEAVTFNDAGDNIQETDEYTHYFCCVSCMEQWIDDECSAAEGESKREQEIDKDLLQAEEEGERARKQYEYSWSKLSLRQRALWMKSDDTTVNPDDAYNSWIDSDRSNEYRALIDKSPSKLKICDICGRYKDEDAVQTYQEWGIPRTLCVSCLNMCEDDEAIEERSRGQQALIEGKEECDKCGHLATAFVVDDGGSLPTARLYCNDHKPKDAEQVEMSKYNADYRDYYRELWGELTSREQREWINDPDQYEEWITSSAAAEFRHKCEEEIAEREWEVA